MVAPNLMFEHTLNAIKGWFQPAALDFSAKLSSTITSTVNAGSVVCLNSSGDFITTNNFLTAMPIFLLQGSDAFDVANDGTTAAGNFMHQAIMPNGTMSGLVATGAYELETTEFVDGTYAINATLTGDVDSSTNNGKIEAGTYGTDAICGVVSRGKYNNAHGVSVLAFWPVYFPVTS